METTSQTPITQLLRATIQGDATARDQLWSAIYGELHRVARSQVAHLPPGHTLHPTALVHEAYLRLFGQSDLQFVNRRHFFCLAAQVMRQIRLDDVRKKYRLKRGGGQSAKPLGDDGPVFDQDPGEILAIDEALKRLETDHPRRAEVVMLRYFAGLTVDETASAMNVSPRTVDAEWRFARAWLHRALNSE